MTRPVSELGVGKNPGSVDAGGGFEPATNRVPTGGVARQLMKRNVERNYVFVFPIPNEGGWG